MMKALTLYIVFVFFVMLFVAAIAERGEQFHFRNGEPLSEAQRAVAIFVFLLLVIVSGYGAFKRAHLDWKLRKKKQGEQSPETK